MDGSGADGRAFLFAGFRLDPDSRTLTRDGLPVPLTPMVFSILVLLVERAGTTLTKDELIRSVWAGRPVGDSTISQTIFTLRTALAAAGSRTQLIATVAGLGYRFTGEVRTETAPRAVHEVQAPVGLGESPTAPSPRSPLVRPIAAVAVIAIIAAGFAAYVLRPGPPPVVREPRTVVQAGFQNLTGDHSFDQSLSRVVEVDLGQSPGISVLTGRQVADTLNQMGRPREELLDAPLAGQVCLRNNGQAVVEGAVAPVGRRYLVTLTATSCRDGRMISAQKRLVDRREDVVPALDALIDGTRRNLGESADAVKRFDISLLPGQTGSIAALEAYSEGVKAFDQGRLQDAIALQQHAVDLDTRFAAAHLDLARALFNIGRYADARVEITKAFALKDTANEDLRFSIEILYHVIVDLDYRRALALAKAATDVFPDHLIGWGQQANLDIQFGRFDDAIVDGRKEVGLLPGREGAYARLADALMSAGRMDEAAEVCRDAIAHKAAGGLIAGELAELAVARGDRAAMEAAVAQARGRPWEADLTVVQAQSAYAAGEIRRGDALFDRAKGLYAAAGEDGSLIGHQALDRVLAGEPAAGLKLITPPPPIGPVMDLAKVDMVYALGEAGQARRMQALLGHYLKQMPLDTTLNTVFAPAARAALDLAQGRARDALIDLAPAAPLEARDNAAPYLRGRIDLALNDGAGAAREFHKVIDHPGVDPSDIRHALSWLGLARAEALEKRYGDSRRDYERFLALWRNADPDVPVLARARSELSALPGLD
jgi:DNA-binding winged helix-turn-helix (wHTH) protein/tetratricopeptide (TPR) repeat protein